MKSSKNISFEVFDSPPRKSGAEKIGLNEVKNFGGFNQPDLDKPPTIEKTGMTKTKSSSKPPLIEKSAMKK